MYCKKCGKVIDTDSDFCIYCGNKIKTPTNKILNKTNNNENNIYTQEITKKNKYKIIIIISTIIFIIAISIILIIYNANILNSNTKKNDEPIYNNECNFIFYLQETPPYSEYLLNVEITNKQNNSIKEIRDLKIEIFFEYGITCTLWAKDIEFNIPLKYNEKTMKKINYYNLSISSKDKKTAEILKTQQLQSTSYSKQTYKIIYGLL